jgi:DNA-binding XRE family transcriptional regulator
MLFKAHLWAGNPIGISAPIVCLNARYRTLCKTVEVEMTPEQCAAARALLRWDQATLAEHAGVTRQTISSFERGARTLHPASHDGVEAAFIAAGVEFVDNRGVILDAKEE